MSEVPKVTWQEKIKAYGMLAVLIIAVYAFWAHFYADDHSYTRPAFDCEQPEPAVGEPDWHDWNNACDPQSYDDLVRWGVVDPGGSYEPDGDDYSCPAGARSC